MIKKIGLLTLLCIFSTNANAQMAETMGVLAIDGALSTGGYQAVGQGMNALNKMRVQQDLAQLAMDIQTTYFGNYRNLSKAGLNFGSLPDSDWDVGAEGGGFYIMLKNLDSATCYSAKLGKWGGAKRIDVNNGGDCNGNANTVKLIF